MLELIRSGRQTSYTVNKTGLAQREERLRSYMTFGAETWEWDGLWTVVTFSVPEEKRDRRPKLRRELERLKFATLTDAVWIQARDHGQEVLDIGRELDVDLAVLRASFLSPQSSGLNPIAAFPLAHTRALYDEYHETYSPWLPLVQANQVDPKRALVLRANVLASWRAIARTDPDLPLDLLPEDWPRMRMHALFRDLWESLGPIALQRVRAIMAHHDPELASRLSLGRF